MERQLGDFIPLAIAFLIGLTLGMGLIWIFLRARIESARSESQRQNGIEVARLMDRGDVLAEELGRERTKTATATSASADFQSLLYSSRSECAQLTERANRVSGLESQMGLLQDRFREETSRTAKLSEQSARLPDLEQKLQIAVSEKNQLNQQIADLRADLRASDSNLQSERQNTVRLDAEVLELRTRGDQLVGTQQDLKALVAELNTKLGAERTHLVEERASLENVKEQFSGVFKSLANDILEEKSVRFAEQNKKNIGEILEPLKTQLHEFKRKIDDVYVQEGKDRIVLGEQVRQLTTLNQQLSDDAKSLAQALKGSSKTQGNWGELILERLLEISGLNKGRDYELRETYQREDGRRGQPDVVVNLPGDRHLVIDSKVSLTDYERYVNATDDTERDTALARHFDSVCRHMKGLSGKDYQKLCELNSLDFVIMFVPIESAFAAAIGKDTTLWTEAWSKNVLLVSPSTLIFVLRTVAYLWNQEDQARHVQDIASRGAELYDKLVGFIDDLDSLDDRLRQARDSFDSAYKKLSTGRGSVVRQAQMLKEMGVKPSKTLPAALIEAALEETVVIPEIAAVDESSLTEKGDA